jgi:predicted secreted hydrolase
MTGYLKTQTNRHFGFQATFFRMTTKVGREPSPSNATSPWTPREIFGFHGAVSDLDRKAFLSTERERRGFSRSVLSQENPFSVRIGRNRLDHPRPDKKSLALHFRVANRSYDLSLFPQSPPVWHAKHQKFFTGPGAADWAYYYSYPLVLITGTVTTVLPDGTKRLDSVHGQCWFDHEWMRSSLAKDQIGWIWVWGWNKENTQGVMVYQMLDRGATLSPFHRATILERKGDIWTVTRTNEVRLLAGKSGRCLDPDRIELQVGPGILVRVHPRLDRQFLTGAVPYWEGAARIKLGPPSSPETGKGYLEVTGLADLKGRSLCRKTR